MSDWREIKTNSHEALSVLLLLQRDQAKEAPIPPYRREIIFTGYGNIGTATLAECDAPEWELVPLGVHYYRRSVSAVIARTSCAISLAGFLLSLCSQARRFWR